MLLIICALLSALASPPVTLTAAMPAPGNLFFMVQTDAPRHFYAEIDTSAGLAAAPAIFEFDLLPGETFGHSVQVNQTTPLHLQPEYVRVRVWASDGGEAPAAEQRIDVPFAPPLRVYVAHI